MGDSSDRITSVAIYNNTYHVRSAGSSEHVEELARFVDERMREVAEHTPTVDTLKVAILAALNIADQYFSTKQRLQVLERQVTEMTAKMTETLRSCLGADSP